MDLAVFCGYHIPHVKVVRSWNADVPRIYPMNVLLTLESFLAFGGILAVCAIIFFSLYLNMKKLSHAKLEGAAHYIIWFCLWPQMVETDVDTCTKTGQSEGHVNIWSWAGKPSGLGVWGNSLRAAMIAHCEPQQMSRNPNLRRLADAAFAVAEIGNHEDPDGREKWKYMKFPRVLKINPPSLMLL